MPPFTRVGSGPRGYVVGHGPGFFVDHPLVRGLVVLVVVLLVVVLVVFAVTTVAVHVRGSRPHARTSRPPRARAPEHRSTGAPEQG